MKKKGLKILGFFALFFCSLFTLTACSVNLTSEQQDKIMQVVDNSDVFMQDVLDYLEYSNRKLNKEESFKLLQESQIKLALNYNDIWNNMKIEWLVPGNNQISQVAKVSDGTYVEYQTASDGGYSVSYEKIDVYGENPVMTIYEKDSDGVKSINTTGDIFNDCFRQLNFIEVYGLTEETVLSSKILDNGNNYIAYLVKQKFEYESDNYQISNAYLEFEIENGLLKNCTMQFGTSEYTSSELDGISNPVNFTIKIEYGTANVSIVEAKYQEAVAYLNAQ